MNDIIIESIKDNVVTLLFRDKLFECELKYSKSHGYYAEFVHRNRYHRVDIEKAELK